MNGTERVETPATRRRDATLLLVMWAAMELLLAAMRARTVNEPPYTADEVAVRLTVVILCAMGAVGAWRGWIEVRFLVPAITAIAAASRALTGVRGLLWHEQVYRHGFEVSEVAVCALMVAGTLGMGIALW